MAGALTAPFPFGMEQTWMDGKPTSAGRPAHIRSSPFPDHHLDNCCENSALCSLRTKFEGAFLSEKLFTWLIS